MNTDGKKLSVSSLNEKLRKNYDATAHVKLNPNLLGRLAGIKRKRIINFMKWLGLDLQNDMAYLCGDYVGLVERVIAINAIEGIDRIQIKSAVEKIFQLSYGKLPARSFMTVLSDAINLSNKTVIGESNDIRMSKFIKKAKPCRPNTLKPAVVNHVLNVNNDNVVNNTQENIICEPFINNQNYSADQNEIDNTYQALLAKISNEMFPNDAPCDLRTNQEQLNYQPLLESISKEMFLDDAPVLENQEQLNYQQLLATISKEMFPDDAFSVIQDNHIQNNSQQSIESHVGGEGSKLTNLKYNELIFQIKEIFADARNFNQDIPSYAVFKEIRALFNNAFSSNQVMIEYLATYNIKLIEKNSTISLYTLAGWKNISDEFLIKRKHESHITNILSAIIDYATGFEKNKMLLREDLVKVESELANEVNVTTILRILGSNSTHIKKSLAEYGLVDSKSLGCDCSKVLNDIYQAISVRIASSRKDGQDEGGLENAIWQVICGFFKSSLTEEHKLKTFSAWHNQVIILNENTQRITPANQRFFSQSQANLASAMSSSQARRPDDNNGGSPRQYST